MIINKFRKNLLLIKIIIFLVLIINITCTENVEKGSNNIAVDKIDENIDKINILIEEKEEDNKLSILDGIDYNIKYFSQWDIEEDYPYGDMGLFAEGIRGKEYFKFYFDENNRKIIHKQIHTDGRVIRLATYNYLNDGSKFIRWERNYSGLNSPHYGYDIIEYYPSGEIKRFIEYDRNDNILIRKEYEQINSINDEEWGRTAFVYNKNDEMKIYIETTFRENIFKSNDDDINFFKKRETKFIAFGELKDRWFLQSFYNHYGIVDEVRENKTVVTLSDTGERITVINYINKNFNDYFSRRNF